VQVRTHHNASSEMLAQQTIIHDLRDQIAVVVTAERLLERNPPHSLRMSLVTACADAVARLGELTSTLLGGGRPAGRPVICNPVERLTGIATMAQALAGKAIEVEFELDSARSCVRVVPDFLDAIVLELVIKAVAANASEIVVRSRKVGTRLLLMVADDGRGMTPAQLTRAMRGIELDGPHSTGLRRLMRFVESAHGTLRLRSRPGRGTVVCLNLPTVLGLTVQRRGTPHEDIHQARGEDR
jgi:signal transduction histidine kinase